MFTKTEEKEKREKEIKLLLTASVKNDGVVIGCVKEGEVLCRVSLSVSEKRTSDEYALLLRDMLALYGFAKTDFSHAMLSSVVPSLTDTLQTAIERFLGQRVFVLSGGMKTGLSILTDHPRELGADLVASAVGALCCYAPPMILVDFGMAITFSVIDRSGAFVGCAIAPGMALSGKALSDAAALLPDVAHGASTRVIGKNTEESLRSGMVIGTAAMVDGMLARMEAALGEEAVTAVASGKLADAVLAHTLREWVRDDHLIERGLYEIDRKNKRK